MADMTVSLSEDEYMIIQNALDAYQKVTEYRSDADFETLRNKLQYVFLGSRDQSDDVFIADEMATDNVAVINQAGYCEPCQAFYEYPNHTH